MRCTTCLVLNAPEVVCDVAEQWCVFVHDQLVEDSTAFFVEMDADVHGIHGTQLSWGQAADIWNGTVDSSQVIYERLREPFSSTAGYKSVGGPRLRIIHLTSIPDLLYRPCPRCIVSEPQFCARQLHGRQRMAATFTACNVLRWHQSYRSLIALILPVIFTYFVIFST